MTYRKPEVQRLGDAASVIQLLGKVPVAPQFDPVTTRRDFIPAYNLDE